MTTNEEDIVENMISLQTHDHVLFFDLLNKDAEFFSLKLVYDKDDRLSKAVLNGKEYEREND